MAESKYESKIGRIVANSQVVYATLGDLNNINRISHLIPQNTMKELQADSDSISFKVDGLAQHVTIRIVEREERKTLKFAIDNLPVNANLWIQFKQLAECDTRIKLTIKADIPTMFRMMLDKKIQQGIDQAVDMLCGFPYSTMTNH